MSKNLAEKLILIAIVLTAIFGFMLEFFQSSIAAFVVWTAFMVVIYARYIGDDTVGPVVRGAVVGAIAGAMSFLVLMSFLYLMSL